MSYWILHNRILKLIIPHWLWHHWRVKAAYQAQLAWGHDQLQSQRKKEKEKKNYINNFNLSLLWTDSQIISLILILDVHYTLYIDPNYEQTLNTLQSISEET